MAIRLRIRARKSEGPGHTFSSVFYHTQALYMIHHHDHHCGAAAGGDGMMLSVREDAEVVYIAAQGLCVELRTHDAQRRTHGSCACVLVSFSMMP